MAPDGAKRLERPIADAVSAAYAAWAAGPLALPDAAVARAKRAFVDIVACMIPGAYDPAAARIAAVARDWGIGPCTVIGSTVGRPAPVAALLNGVAAHALDFDDNFDPAKAHITAVLAPALLALAEPRGLAGRKVIEAYVVGIEIAARIGQGLNPVHRNRGWHATSTVGAVAAAAAAGRLIGLDAEQMRHALNMSTSFAGGFMSQFGSMTKPLHAGKAAEAGVVCATLAAGGVTAGAETFDGPTGMARLMVGPDLDMIRDNQAFTSEHGQTLRFETESLGRPLAILEHGLKVKRYPTCASTHRALDGLIDLRTRHGFSANDVTRIDIAAPTTHFNNLMYRDPKTGAEAKFSMEYCIAVALRRGAVGLQDFMPEALADPSTRALLPVVVRHPVDRAESEFPTRVDVHLTSGRTLSTLVDAPKGRADNPLSDAELDQKLRLCCRGHVDQGRVEEIALALAALDGPSPVGRLMALLRFDAVFAGTP